MQEIENLIDARNLKIILSNGNDFSRWIKRKIKRHNLLENKDFIVKIEKIKFSANKTIKINYLLTIEASTKIILNCRKNPIAEIIKERLKMGNNLEDILRKIKNEKDSEMSILKLSDCNYPEQLRKIKNPPKQLYVKGNIENMKEYGISVIGTRKCSNYGRKVCRNFTKNLVGYNLNIISGLAQRNRWLCT